VETLISHWAPQYRTSKELVVPRIRESRHARLLSDSKVCLAPWGNHPLTYRLFEGMAFRCLVVAQPIRDTAFLDGGLEAGRHYVEVAADLHDLVDVVRHYLEHLDEAQRIADAGHEHFKRFFEARRSLVSSYFFESTVASWSDLYRPTARRSIATATRSLVASLFADRF
jgi:glycosyltransferase involved in cell wall biosynthesis